MIRKSTYQWAKEYTGDPESHEQRGLKIMEFMVELGLKETHRVLDIGCGSLSQGQPLINYLNPGNYVGMDPNGWLIEAALQENGDLLKKNPTFIYNSDFDAKGEGEFDFVVAHSVLSHAAHWQMEQALQNVRRVTKQGGIWLASLRIDQYNLFSTEWVYPGVSYFRLPTVQMLGWYAGWDVQISHDFKERLVKVAPNDVHDWITLTATLTPEKANDIRLQMDEERQASNTNKASQQAQYERLEGSRMLEMETAMMSARRNV